MAYEPLVKEETPAPPAAPDPMDAVNAQLVAMREQINLAYQMNKGLAPAQPQVQYIPVPMAAQQVEQPLTEADMLADLPTSVSALAERIAAEKETQLRQELGVHLGHLYERDFERELKDLSARPYYKDVAADLQVWTQQNPTEKFQPGRLMSKFHELVGAKAMNEPLRQVEEVERVRAVDHALPTSSSLLPSAPSKREKVELDESREAVRQSYNRQFGLNMTAEEWDAIENKDLLKGTRD